MPTSRSNKVKLKNETIDSINYIDKSLVITSGQPSTTPPKISNSGDTWTIEINCGRKGDSSVAKKFVSACGGSGHAYCPSSFMDNEPGKLNFYFGVRIGFKLGGTVYYEDIYLGQGHTGARNNWWIGGNNVAHDSKAILNIPSMPDGSLEEVYTITGGVSDFSFSQWIKASNSKAQPNWMKAIPDNTPICNINIPGTHDSAAINRYTKTPYACHYHTLSEQLRSGVRLLDIRLSVHEKNGNYTFNTCHGNLGSSIGLNEYQSLPSALDECKTFLVANSSEFIAMSLKVDAWNSTSNKNAAYTALENLLAKYPVYKSSSMPNLSGVRGHIYLLNRMNNDISLGVPISVPDNTMGSLEGKVAGKRDFDFYVQDKYTDLGSNAEKEKYKLFIDAMEKAVPDLMVYNFASGVQKVLMGVYIMNLVLQYFGSKQLAVRPKLLGWMLFDYISTNYNTDTYGSINVIELIISSNFNYDGYQKTFEVGLEDGAKDEL